MTEDRTRQLLFSLRRYFTFFVLMSFVVTCCMLTFLSLLTSAMELEPTTEQIRGAAILTFGNVILLTLIFTVIDGLRRKLMVDRPVRRIISAAEEIMRGNFSVRIQPIHSMDSCDGFDLIIDYINRMAEELSGIETLRTDFIANVSHELKTPLSVIQNYSTMLQRPDLPEDRRAEYAQAIMDASRRLSGLITNILKLNKLENQQIYPEKAVFDLGEQLCQCLLSFEAAWEEKDIKLEIDLAEGVRIQSDPELLTLVWNNLISNAMKFTPPGGRVTVGLEGSAECAVVQIADTGCGILPEVGQHMFEKFYQGDASHAAQGNGLGLALVKRVVDIVGGDISVRSEVGAGSTFTVKLRRGLYESG